MHIHVQLKTWIMEQIAERMGGGGEIEREHPLSDP